MSAAPNKKPSLALGLILILLLLAAVIFGGIWVVQAAFTPRMSDAKAAAEAGSTPAKEPTVQAEPVVQEPDPQKQPAQEQPFICACCGKPLQPVSYKNRTVEPAETAASTKKKFGRILCWTCAKKQPKEG